MGEGRVYPSDRRGIDGFRWAVGGDILGPLAQEVVLATHLPQGLQFIHGEPAILELVDGGIARFVDPVLLVHRVLEAPSQGTLGLGVQLAQQAATPGIPQGWVGAVDVGNGQRKQVIETVLVAHVLGELQDNFRVGDVTPLGYGRHGQVVAHQPGHQVGVAL